MAGINGAPNGAAKASPDSMIKLTRLLDLDAFTSPVKSHVRVDGVEYPIRQLLHLTGQEELDLAKMDSAVKAAEGDHGIRAALFDRAFTMVRILVPDLPERVRLDLTYAQALAIAAHAWDYVAEAMKADPTLADTGAAPAENSKPASAASTVSTPAV